MRRLIVGSLTTVAILAAVAYLAIPMPAATQAGLDTRYLSFVPVPFSPGVLSTAGPVIPPDCSTWHELWPNYCGTSHQDAYEDNGDGMVSACDGIVLDGVSWHVAWVGPTYYLTCFGPTGQSEVIWEPNQGPHDPSGPVCETWHEVWPNFCTLNHIDDWNDADGSGTITVCDDVFANGNRYHVDDIRLNIIIEPPGTPVERSTWGRIKSWVHDTF